MTHFKCRGKFYPGFNSIRRLQFSDDLVPWTCKWADYKPSDFTAPGVIGKPWADLDVSNPAFNPSWNDLDGKIDRRSFMGIYEVQNKRPLNPMGRTGLSGRGLLGKWGPNHAADPVVSRWKTDNSGVITHPESRKKILQFVAIQRRDSGEWAIPGGMVDPGEVVTSTLKREFLEEATNALEEKNGELREKNSKLIDSFFETGSLVYKGYVDDPRNTDNAWMETTVMNFHDDTGLQIGALALTAGDDAKNVCWMDVSSNLKLYASHSSFLAEVSKKLNAHW